MPDSAATKKSATARVQVIHQTTRSEQEEGWRLYLQWCRYFYDDGVMQEGYRFIWRRPNGSLQAARGQARIPSLSAVSGLIERANSEGWGQLVAESAGTDNGDAR